MQRVVMVLVVLLGGGVGVASADEHPTWYAGVGVGASEFKAETGIVLPSDPPQVQTYDESDELTKIWIGYKPIKYFGIEGSVLAGGDFTSTEGESSPGAGDGFEVAVENSGYDLSALGILPLVERRVDVYVRLGVQRNEYRLKIRDQVDSGFSGDIVNERIKQTNRLIGAGVQVNFGGRKQMGVRLEYNVVQGKDQIDDLSETILGFSYGWGGKN